MTNHRTSMSRRTTLSLLMLCFVVTTCFAIRALIRAGGSDEPDVPIARRSPWAKITARHEDGSLWDETLLTIGNDADVLRILRSDWKPNNEKLILPAKVGSDVLEAAVRKEGLRGIWFRSSVIESDIVKEMSERSDIAMLRFESCQIGKDAFKTDSKFARLQGVWFLYSEVQDGMLSDLHSIAPFLEVISFVGDSVGVSNSGISIMKRFAHLEDLELRCSNCPRLSPACCDDLESMPNLRSLYVPHIDEWRACLERLGQVKKNIQVDGNDL